MKALLAVLMMFLALACSSDNEKIPEPSLSASSDSDGVLHVSGSGWAGCTRVMVELPEPWGTSDASVSGDGRFSLVYPHPLVEPYQGDVFATCTTAPDLEAAVEIQVGDPRVQE